MERLVTNRLTWYIEKHNLMSRVQSGFRRNCSTIDQIARLHDTIVKRLNTRGHVLAVFLDMEKAFDMVWRKGLMIKLKRVGINGHMFRWIDTFMSDRTIQVRVGSTLSDTVILENGTAQGAMISPSAFISMIDDLPNSVTTADTSLFADDGMLFVEGKSVQSIGKTTRNMQTALTQVHTWCDEWGFKLSSDKSVAVMFSLKQSPPPRLTIDGRTVKIQESARFLGMIFDQRLTWREHIEYVTGVSRKRLNLMRAISGQTWGCNMSTLRTVYLALVRSKIAYGAAVYGSAQSEVLLQSLDDIQNRALRICCGAMKSTSIAAMQVMCNVMPLALHRLAQQTRFAIKVKATHGHVAKSMFKAHWSDKYEIRRNLVFGNRLSMAVKTLTFFQSKPELEKITTGPKWADIPPWLARLPETDTELTTAISKHRAPGILASLAREKIDAYRSSHQVHVYTDASRSPAGHVGIGCVYSGVTAETASYHFEEHHRVTDDVSVFAGELAAVGTAVSRVAELARTQGWRTFAVFSDSLSTIECFRRGRCVSRPNLFDSVVTEYNRTDATVTLVWVPSHIGIPGNEQADRTAAKGTEKDHTDMMIGLELRESYSLADSYITEKWQSQWSAATTGRLYHRLQPRVRSSIGPMLPGRRLDVMARRLRLGRCSVNAILHSLKCHDTGLCDTCSVPETIQHFLLECTGTVAAAVRDTCADLGVPPYIDSVLGNAAILTVIAENSKSRRL